MFEQRCLDGIDPKVCPLCREEFSEESMECNGPWEQQDNWDKSDEEEEVEEDTDGEEDWTPRDEEREEDSAAWQELVRARWQDYAVDDCNEDYEDEDGDGDDDEAEGEEHEWSPLGDEVDEDRAAWDELERLQWQYRDANTEFYPGYEEYAEEED